MNQYKVSNSVMRFLSYQVTGWPVAIRWYCCKYTVRCTHITLGSHKADELH